MIDLESRLRTSFARVAESEEVPPLPAFGGEADEAWMALDELLDADRWAPPRRQLGLQQLGPRRRRVVAGIAALAIVGGGLSLAAAAGLHVLPSSVMQSLGWESTPGAYNADPSTARRLLSVPGPDGVALQLWYADASDDGFCLTLSASVSADPHASGGFAVDPADEPRNGVGGGGCDGPKSSASWRAFGGAAFTAANSESATFIVHVPGAATVWLKLDDGTTRQLPVGQDWTAGWMSQHDAQKHPVLVGLAPDGTQLGTFAIADLMGSSPAQSPTARS